MSTYLYQPALPSCIGHDGTQSRTDGPNDPEVRDGASPKQDISPRSLDEHRPARCPRLVSRRGAMIAARWPAISLAKAGCVVQARFACKVDIQASP
jgi:hypothetical protein